MVKSVDVVASRVAKQHDAGRDYVDLTLLTTTFKARFGSVVKFSSYTSLQNFEIFENF